MLLVSLVSNNLSNYERRHFKLFTNCHVLWDTLYEKTYLDDVLGADETVPGGEITVNVVVALQIGHTTANLDQNYINLLFVNSRYKTENL